MPKHPIGYVSKRTGLRWVGDAWHEGSLGIGQEHRASASVKTFLPRLRQTHRITLSASSIAIASPAGESHEIGALMAFVVTTAEGWGTLYFGPNLPASELAHAAQQSSVQAVDLSISLSGEQAHWIQEISYLRQYHPDRISIILGGSGTVSNRLHLESTGVRCVDTFGEFQLELRKIAA